jgi:hypothetical protein
MVAMHLAPFFASDLAYGVEVVAARDASSVSCLAAVFESGLASIANVMRERPPPGTIIWACGWWISGNPQVWSTAVSPIKIGDAITVGGPGTCAQIRPHC